MRPMLSGIKTVARRTSWGYFIQPCSGMWACLKGLLNIRNKPDCGPSFGDIGGPNKIVEFLRVSFENRPKKRKAHAKTLLETIPCSRLTSLEKLGTDASSCTSSVGCVSRVSPRVIRFWL